MWRIAKKDLTLFFTDRKALFLSLLLPIGLITLFAFAFGGVVTEDEPEPTAVFYSDQDVTDASRMLLQLCDSLAGFQFVASDEGTAMAKMKEGSLLAFCIIEKGFSDSLAQGKNLPVVFQYDAGRNVESAILQNMLSGTISGMQRKVDAERGIDAMVNAMMPPSPQRDSLAQNMKNNAVNKERKKPMTTISVLGEEENNWGLIQAVAGTAIMMLLFSVSAVGKSLLDENESGVLKKLLQSPLHPFGILMGKMTAATIIAFFQLIVLFLYAHLAFGLDILVNVPALLIMLFVTGIVCSAFGILLSSLVQTRRQADALGTILILFMSGIGGSMIPLYIMPVFMQKLAVISINYWSIQGFYDIFWRNTGLQGIADNVWMLLAFTTGILLISAVLFKKNLQKIR